MRAFLPKEKAIMDYICGLDVLSAEISISNLISRFCPCTLQYPDNILTLLYDPHKHSEQEVVNSVLTFICLLEYLRSESLIYVFQLTNAQDRKEIINKQEGHVKTDDGKIIEQRNISIDKDFVWEINGTKIKVGNSALGFELLSQTIIPWSVASLIERYAKSVIFCTETLRHLKNQGYIDDATIQYKESRRQTWWAIFISFIVGIAGIIVSFITYYQNNIHHKENMLQSPQVVVIRDTITVAVHDIIIQSAKTQRPKYVAKKTDENKLKILNDSLEETSTIAPEKL